MMTTQFNPSKKYAMYRILSGSLIILCACNSAQKELPIKDSTTPSSVKTDTSKMTSSPVGLDSNRIVAFVKNNPWIDSSSTFVIERTIMTNGVDKYAIISASSGTCRHSYLVLIDGHQSIEKCVEMEANCDSDLSRASYSYKIFTTTMDTVFNIEIITQRVADTSLVAKNGHLKDDQSLDDVETKTDTVFKRITPTFLTTDSVPRWPKFWR
jgi:hypothetical protein